MPLQQTTLNAVLTYLKITATQRNFHLLESLVESYVRHVPWESASRIARRSQITDTENCPRWAETFWLQAMEEGTGGTCFESNYAFFHLLTALGFEGYLTINNMGDTVGCHTAIIILLNGNKWLVDVGLPIFAPLLLDQQNQFKRETSLLNYTVNPLGENRFDIFREPHPSSNAFTLIDRPIDDETYRLATIADYGEGGLFLDKVIINKVIDNTIWRFNSAEKPLRIEHFEDGTRIDIPLEGDTYQGDTHMGDISTTLARRFGIRAGIIKTALESL